MKLEDNICHTLFRKIPRLVEANINDDDVIIECKAQDRKPIPLCMPHSCHHHVDVAYRQLHTSMFPYATERSSPRAMFNWMFDKYANDSLNKLKIKNVIYYSALGALFDENLDILFYFAWDIIDEHNKRPVLCLTPTLLYNSSVSGKPMEKFFMSTIVPFLVNNAVWTVDQNYFVTIEIDNHPDDTFFVPVNTLVSTTPVDRINDELNDILADNADQISQFINNYESII